MVVKRREEQLTSKSGGYLYFFIGLVERTVKARSGRLELLLLCPAGNVMHPSLVCPTTDSWELSLSRPQSFVDTTSEQHEARKIYARQ